MTVRPTAPPPRGGPAERSTVPRPALFARLTEADRVTHVSAPAGAGKSVLVRSWLADAGLQERAGWLTVTRVERDPRRFWIAVRETLAATGAASLAHRAVTPAPDLSGATIVDDLLEDLTALDERAYLIIDDLHELQDAESLGQLERLIAEAPDSLRFVLLTRRDLRLGLHRLRLAGELSEIRQSDLRFTVEDARSLFKAAGQPLSDEVLSVLVDRTEGWVAGLRLAVLSMRGSEDPDGLARRFSGSERTVAEYLLAEVLERLAPEVRSLLLATSILERVSGPLADHLAGGSRGQAILVELEEANAFVVALDSERIWFRSHRLFADLLALELRRTEPDRIPDLHLKAATWFEQHGFGVEAIGHAQAAGEWSLAVRLLSDHWYGLYLDGRTDTAQSLLDEFPPGMAAADPELAVIAAAAASATGAVDQAQRFLAVVTRGLASVSTDRRARLEFALAVVRLNVARVQNDLPVVVEEARGLLAGGRLPLGRAPEEFGDLSAVALASLAAAEIWTGHHADADGHLEQAYRLARRLRRPLIEVITLSHQALLAGLRSEPRAEALAEQAIELAQAHGWAREPFVGLAYTVLGTVRLLGGQLSDAETWLDLAEAALGSAAEPAVAVTLHASRGLLELGRGDPQQAVEEFGVAARLSQLLVHPHLVRIFIDAHHIQALVAIGDLERAERALTPGEAAADEPAEMMVVRADLYLAQDDPERAAATLARIDLGTEGHLEWTIQALLLEAVACDRLNDAGGTARALERALDLAEPAGLLLAFLLVDVAHLIERHQRLRGSHASLISDIQSLLAGHLTTARTSHAAPIAEPLSQSELRVLRYLPTNLRAPEIAGELFVSVNTVRTHMRHVYTKLGVHGRADAVTRARSLGLLAPGR